MKTVLAFSALAAVASANLAGISIDAGVFSIANINPDTGATVASTTTIRTRAGGALAFDATTMADTDNLWSLQTNAAGAATLVRQDLRIGGRREECWFSTDTNAAKPVSIFNDVQGGSVIATGVKSGNFGIYRFGINPNNRICTETAFLTLPASQLAPQITAQFGNRIFVAYEGTASTFLSTRGPIIASFDVSATAVTTVSTTTASAGLYYTSIAADSATTVIAQGFDASSSTVSFGNWKIDLTANTVGAIRSPISTTGTSISTASTYVAQSKGHYALKLVTSAANVVTANLAFFDYTTAGASNAEITRATATSNQIFKLFDLSNAKFTAIDADANIANTIRLTGTNLYAAAGATSVSRCRFTIASATAALTPVTAQGYAASDGVTCPLPASLGSGTVVSTEFAADGVNYVTAPKFVYGSASVASAKFSRSRYTLDDGSAQASNQDTVSVEIFDASGNKVLFTSALSATITAQSGDSSFASISGNTATSSNGRFNFPSLAIDVYSTTAANDLANIKLNFASGSTAASADATARFIRNSRGNAAGLTLASSKFSYALVNPSSTTTSSIALGDRTVTTGSSIAFGIHAYDNLNDVLNTVEITSAGAALLVGQPLRSASQAAGAGSCIIPVLAGFTNSPVALAYEKTDATTGAVTFLALVDVGTKTGTDFKIVRYTRAQGSAATTTCTTIDVAELPMWSVAYAKAAFLTGGRLAIVEMDSESSTGGSLLHVYTMGDTKTAGSWAIRNKALSFSVIGLTQSGENEVAINGRMSTTDGVWRVNIANDAAAVTAPTALKETFSAASEQAYFLASGTSLNSDASQRLSGSVNSVAARNLDVVELTGSSVTNAASKSVSALDYINLFNVNDANVVSVANSAANEITVAANNVIRTSALTCRFASAGLTSFTRAATSTGTGTFPTNGGSYSCGAIPTAFLSGSRAVYVALANDQTNFGAPGCVSVGTVNQCPTVTGVTANPSNAPSTSGSTAVPVNRQIVFFFAGKTSTDCATSVATINAFLTSAGVKFTTVTTADCVFNANYVSTTVTTSAVRMLQGTSGVVINSILETAADKNTAVAFAQTTAGQAALGGATLNDANPATTTTDEDDGLTDGEIAGIVIGSVAGVILIGALIAFALKGSSSKAPAASSSAPAATYSTRDATFTDATTASTSASGSYDSTSGSGSYDSDSGSYDSEDYSDYSGSSYV